MNRIMPVVCLVLCAVGLSACSQPNGLSTWQRLPRNTHNPAFDRTSPVHHWNQLLVESFAADQIAPPEAARRAAILNLGLFVAATGGEGYTLPMELPFAKSNIVPTDAVNAAGRYTMSVLFPNRQQMWDAEYTIVSQDAQSASRAFGEAVARKVFRERNSDGAGNSFRYLGINKPGQWSPTPPYFESGLLPQFSAVRTFVLTSSDQFRVDSAPSIDSSEFIADRDRIAQIGNSNSPTRTKQQEQIARFWADGKGTYTPPGSWIRIALDQISAHPDMEQTEQLRLMALMSIAMADGAIACWDSKYHHNVWRPVAAINHATGAEYGTDAYWMSYLENPNFPEYPSGHSVFSASAATVLTSFFGDTVSIKATSLGEPGVVRSFDSFSDAAQEAAQSRIYGGIHYDFAAQAGLAQGRQVAEYVMENTLTPLDQ